MDACRPTGWCGRRQSLRRGICSKMNILARWSRARSYCSMYRLALRGLVVGLNVVLYASRVGSDPQGRPQSLGFASHRATTMTQSVAHLSGSVDRVNSSSRAGDVISTPLRQHVTLSTYFTTSFTKGSFVKSTTAAHSFLRRDAFDHGPWDLDYSQSVASLSHPPFQRHISLS